MSAGHFLDLSLWEEGALADLASQVHAEVRAVSLRRREPTNESVDSILAAISNRTSFPALKSITLASLLLDEEQVRLLCSIISSRETDCLWETVGLIRCSLGERGSRQVMESLVGHPIVQSINLTGNGGSDQMMAAAVAAITKPGNRITELNLSANRLTRAALDALADCFCNSSFCLQSLSLSNNPFLFASDALSRTFSLLVWRGLPLRELCLSGCSLSEASWARYLPFIQSLQYLDLSHNLLEDGALLQLCMTLEHNAYLISVDLSYNHFLGVMCTVVEQLFSSNQSLHSFSLAGNRFNSEHVWRSIAQGMSTNKSLLSLDLSDCAISAAILQDLGSMFCTNDTVSLLLSLNPLPSGIINNPRDYFTQRDPSRYLPLATDSSLKCMDAAEAWRAAKAEAVQLSIDSQPHVNLPATASAKEKYTQLWQLIEGSSYYLSEQDLDKVVADAHNAHMSKRIFVDIVFGRTGGISIGHVQIHALTTYETVRMNIIPLVEEYCQSADPEALKEYLQFDILDVKGEKVNAQDAKKRKIWIEIWNLSEPFLVIRPSTWISLGDTFQEQEEEEATFDV